MKPKITNGHYKECQNMTMELSSSLEVLIRKYITVCPRYLKKCLTDQFTNLSFTVL